MDLGLSPDVSVQPRDTERLPYSIGLLDCLDSSALSSLEDCVRYITIETQQPLNPPLRRAAGI